MGAVRAGSEDFFAPGDWNIICSICGTKLKAGEAVQNWQGMWRHPKCNEPRQPQDFVMPLPQKEMSIPFTQKDGDPNIIAPAFPASGVNVTNTFAFAITVFWYPQGANVSQIKVNGSPITIAPSFTVPAGQTIQFTYTGNTRSNPPMWMWTGSFQP